jgi:Glyoxalase-like domain
VCDVDLIWEQVVVDAHDPGALGRWWAEALGWVVVGDAADEFEIRPTPDRVPGLLFVPVPEEKAGKNRLHPTSVRSIKPQKSNVSFPSCSAGRCRAA